MTITLFPNFTKDTDCAVTAEVTERLAAEGCLILADKESADVLRERFPSAAAKLTIADGRLFTGSDAGVVIGGDGSILRVAREAARASLPLLGVNLGRVGYIAEIETGELDLLKRFTLGDFRIERRFMIEAELKRGGVSLYKSAPALNDVTVSNGQVAGVMSFDISYDGSEPFAYRSNGIVFATPTGSTALSMSAGGAVLESAMEGICLTPICPVLLMNRPVVMSGDSVITLTCAHSREGAVYLTVDGCGATEIKGGDCVTIRASEYKTKLIKLKKHGFLSVLKNKITDI